MIHVSLERKKQKNKSRKLVHLLYHSGFNFFRVLKIKKTGSHPKGFNPLGRKAFF